MQNGCEFPNPTKDLPKAYKGSIIKKTFKGDPNIENDNVGFDTTYHLKDSMAFGLPIKAIAYHQGYEDSALTVFFKDSSFTKLRPTFNPPKIDADYVSIDENDSNGYSASTGGYTDLAFTKKDKSITCATGV